MNKNTKIVAALITLGLVSPMAYATNGDTMMSVGTQNTALGGSGVANFVGAESTFANPGMIGKSKGAEVNVGIVLFKPSVTNTGATVTTPSTSAANTSYIPDVSYSSRINDNLSFGVAMAGIAGMGVDYTEVANAASYFKARTTLNILNIVPTIAYNDKDYGVGFSPVLQYGALGISFNAVNPAHDKDTHSGVGYAFGGYYNVMPALTVAASYQSSIAHSYGVQLSRAGTAFGQTFADNLDQPAEMKAGVAYTLATNYTLTADYRMIQWAGAKGYKEFGWKDQTVIALGGKYAGEGYWVGLGYNQSDNPIGEYPAGTNAFGNDGTIVNMFNNLFFPATIKNSYTFGGGYSVSKAVDIDAAVVISPEVTTKVVTTNAGAATNTNTHSQQSFAVSMRYKF